MDSVLAPLAIFVYNRSHVMDKMLNAINENYLCEQTEVFIFSDGAKNEEDEEKVKQVRARLDVFSKINNFKNVEIIASEKNKGLANSIIQGVTTLINKYGKVIVLEDDLITSKSFLKFMNDCLCFYEFNEKVWSIGGVSYNLPGLQEYKQDIYACWRGQSWGWGTWKDRWDKVDWNISDYAAFMKNRKRKKMFQRGGQDMVESLRMQMTGKIDSWAIRWCYQESKENMITILPKKSLIQNIGWGEESTHCDVDRFHIKVDVQEYEYKLEDVVINNRLMKEFRVYYSKPIYQRILDYLYIKLKEKNVQESSCG